MVVISVFIYGVKIITSSCGKVVFLEALTEVRGTWPYAVKC